MLIVSLLAMGQLGGVQQLGMGKRSNANECKKGSVTFFMIKHLHKLDLTVMTD
jgi:hypothetical protein